VARGSARPASGSAPARACRAERGLSERSPLTGAAWRRARAHRGLIACCSTETNGTTAISGAPRARRSTASPAAPDCLGRGCGHCPGGGVRRARRSGGTGKEGRRHRRGRHRDAAAAGARAAAASLDGRADDDRSGRAGIRFERVGRERVVLRTRTRSVVDARSHPCSCPRPEPAACAAGSDACTSRRRLGRIVTLTASFPALGTTAAVAVAAADPDTLSAARGALERELAAIDRACSRFRDDSELSRANANAGREVRVGPLLLEALRVALRVARLTGGLVDPTVGRTLRLAGYDRTFRLVAARDGSSFEARFERVPGWSCVSLDEERSLLRVPEGVELDLGASGKALAADRGAAAATEAAGCGVLVGLGGDISIAGEPPPEGWPVRLADDHAADLDSSGPTVALAGGGLASSGTTVRRWRSAAAEIHHIVDPRTGRPAVTPWRTVSVAAATCVDANAAGTAAVVLGSEAPAWLEAHALPARLVQRDGAPVCVGGWPPEAP